MRLKRLELWWRALWIRILVRLMRRPRSGERPEWGTRPHRILFLRHDRAGDMIVSTGVMRAIANSHATLCMDVLASPANAAIIAGADYVHDTIVFDKKKLASYVPTLLRLRRARYDAVIDCMVTAPSVTTLLLILASGARFRIGIAGRGNDAAFNVTVPADSRVDAHMVDLLAALTGAFGVESPESRPVLTLSDEERASAEIRWGSASGRRVLINVSAGTSERTWPDARFAAVMQRVTAREPDALLRVIGAPNERARAESVASAGGGSYVATSSMREAMAMVSTADLVVTPDTSITHAASAFRTPAVVLFVRGKSERWGLYDTPGANVEHTEPTLETLPLERVSAAVDELLNRPLERRGVRDAALRETR